jgi:hypothetical protein
LRATLRQAIEASFVDAFRAIMWVAAALAVGGGVIAWIFIDRMPAEASRPTPGRSRPPGR